VILEFQPNDMSKITNRLNKGLTSLISSLGGTFTGLKILGSLITGLNSYRLLTSSLIGKLFHFEPKFYEVSKKKKKYKD